MYHEPPKHACNHHRTSVENKKNAFPSKQKIKNNVKLPKDIIFNFISHYLYFFFSFVLP